MSWTSALVCASPWLLLPPLALLRVARSRSLDTESGDLPQPPPSISLVLPARNEERNIERCLRSILSTTYPALEVIVVDDHSEDATARIARDMAATDGRLRVLASPPVPAGWFGKQWACTTGAAQAAGQLLLFIDADTWHAPDLLSRAVNAGRQETRGFWERLVQPQVFWMLLVRYGGTEGINRATRATDVIASGQFLLVRRTPYESVGGHEAVRGKVAEDLALAQRLFSAGFRVAMVLGRDRLVTHMYASLDELIRGWGKNVYAAGLDAMPGGAVGRFLFPLLLPLFPLMTVLPSLVLLLGLGGFVGRDWLVWSVACVASSLVWWAIIYRGFEQSRWYALLHPVGAAIVLYIIARAIARGRRVHWKGREYVAR